MTTTTDDLPTDRHRAEHAAGRAPTVVVHDQRGQPVGRANPITGQLYTMACTPSAIGSKAHRRRRWGAYEAGIARSQRVAAHEDQVLDRIRKGGRRDYAIPTRAPHR